MASLQNDSNEHNAVQDDDKTTYDPAANSSSSNTLNTHLPNTKDGTPKPSHSQYTKTRRPWRLNVTGFDAIIAQPYRGRGTESDPYIVEWLDIDPENPKTYSNWMRWSVTILSAVMTLCVAFASSAYSGAVGPMIKEFECSEEVIILGLSMNVLGYAVGPLLWAPMSETLGRRNVFAVAFAFYTIWTSVCAAAQNVWTLIIFRFLAGTFGSSALVIPGGQIADMFLTETRGIGIGIFCVAPFTGPALGPMVGGFLGDAAGWRWVMGFLGIFTGLLAFTCFLFTPETYAPVLLRSRAKLLSEVTGHKYLTAMDAQHPLVIKELVKRALVRPWILLLREPIVLFLTVILLQLLTSDDYTNAQVRYICPWSTARSTSASLPSL
jgi:multidrug resistance protein